jgi:hypothetical protein
VNIGQIWEVARPLINTAIIILTIGLILQAIQRKIKSGITKESNQSDSYTTIGTNTFSSIHHDQSFGFFIPYYN